MSESESGYPSVKSLWTGCILGSIAHAVSTVKFPEFSHEQSWDGINYSVQDSAGTRGTISFSPEQVFGAFRDDNSLRLNAFGDPSSYLEGAPEAILAFAHQEALQYLLDDVNGIAKPVITAALWSKQDRIVSRDSWPVVVAHGAHILRRQLLPFDLALAEWAEYCELDSDMTAIVTQLYNAKMEQPATLIAMPAGCLQVLKRQAKSQSAIKEASNSFSEIGFTW